MPNHKHLSFDDRLTIETMLKQKFSFKKIALSLDKDPTTISKEIRGHLLFQRTGGMNKNYNACKLRFQCKKSHLCSTCHSQRKFRLCKRCSMCNSFCDDFVQEICQRLSRPPYVCNGCKDRYSCTLEKRFYSAKHADSEYRLILSESRRGISLSEEEIRYLNHLITPLIRQGQSPHHICSHNKDSIMISERTLYRLIDTRVFSAMNIDLPRKVRYCARKKTVHHKVDRSCRIRRTYNDLLSYIHCNPDPPIVELDSVEGKKGSSVLLTIHFVKAQLMLAFLRDRNDSQSVIDIFESLYSTLQPRYFMDLFKICLADNGSEFSNPSAIEYDRSGRQRTRIFYCDPSAPYQKGSAERNHEFIRCFIPKGEDLAQYSQADISLMMDHINSYGRESLGDKCPYEMFSFLYGNDILDLLGCHQIPPQDVTLNRSIFRKGVSHEDR